jgi:hypothetical protein
MSCLQKLRLTKALPALILLSLPFFAPGIAAAQQTQPAGNTGAQEQSGSSIPRGKKLVMKDGTFQIVSSYEVKGDRVRYYSVERSEWEEMPASQVDWDATKKAEQAEQNQQQELVAKVKTEEAEAKAAAIDVDASLEVAPKVFLPPGEGIFLLDGHAIFPLSQSEASSVLNKGRVVEQVFIPMVPSQHTVYLKGAKAAFRIRNQNPEFYLRTTESVVPEIELIQVRVRGNRRQIENIDSLFGQTQEKRKTILMQQWQMAQGVYRFTLGQSLKPGEYALAEPTPKEGMNLMVWDFGVDPPVAPGSKNQK